MSNTRERLDVLVIGAGVSGLTTAVQLTEAGNHVRVWTAAPPAQTTSFAAGATWGPYLVEPVDRVQAWARESLRVFRQLALDPSTGVRLTAGIEASRMPADPPDWGNQLDGFAICDEAELPGGFATGWRYTAPSVDMPKYLEYLRRRLRAAGTNTEIRRITSLDEATAVAPVVVNCTGIGAQELVPDPELIPVRGQLVVMENPGITEFFSEDTGESHDLLHYIPHGKTIVLGGTAEPGVWNREPDPATADAVIARCASVEPRLRHARLIEHRVGLRPTRAFVRLDDQQSNGATVIHNYGHGGAGVTLSWGCATEILNRIDRRPRI